MVRHARGVPRDVNLLCTNVLQAGFWAQQQPITADLVQQIMAASTGARPFPLGRLGLTAAAGLVLAAGLLWVAPFRTGPQATRSNPAAPCACSWMEAPRPTNLPPARGTAPCSSQILRRRRVQSPPPAVRSDTPQQARATSASRRWSRWRASAWSHRHPRTITPRRHPNASRHCQPPHLIRDSNLATS